MNHFDLYLLFQFTHPGGVRLEFLLLSGFPTLVSIHAPGRGATLDNGGLTHDASVSIHAPGRGATLLRR